MLRTLAFIASGAGLLLFVAGHFASEAFVSSSLPQGRDVSVGRAVHMTGWGVKSYAKAPLEELNDEELHGIIAEGRKQLLHWRMEKWRRKKPSPRPKYEWQYRIAAAKTFLHERKIQRGEVDEDEEVSSADPLKPVAKDYPNRPTLTEQMKMEDLELAKAEWHDIGGWGSRPTEQKAKTFDFQVGFERRYYKKYGKLYEQHNKTETRDGARGWSWDPKLSKRTTNLIPRMWEERLASKRGAEGLSMEANRWEDTFDPAAIDVVKARWAAEKAEKEKERGEKASTNAFAAEKETGPSSASLFVGAAFAGFLAGGCRRRL